MRGLLPWLVTGTITNRSVAAVPLNGDRNNHSWLDSLDRTDIERIAGPLTAIGDSAGTPFTYRAICADYILFHVHLPVRLRHASTRFDFEQQVKNPDVGLAGCHINPDPDH